MGESMKRFHLGAALLLAAGVLIGGWAVSKLLEPGNTLDFLRAFSMC